MAKQLNVNMSVKADTSQARAQIQALQNTLAKIGSTSGTSKMTSDLLEASNAANTLKANLQSAMNVNTGQLDLSKFKKAMDESGMSIAKYRQQLTKCGADGEQAFLQLAQSIQAAEIPLRKSSTLLTNFATTLKNTVRWQISSSTLHSFMGALQSAYGYAKDLDESLNNIRIVTGQNVDQMTRFAKEANKAAQALSTTTTAYTNASLIYYQQGLTDNLVKEYTDVTIKMANVTGDGAKEVSSYMTAIWNNFNKDGDESAEHFADIITALGATTASSSAEIAAGLEKFAAIADVTGLSYEYATSALATLVANTRQSADVVGTSLKTIFSRLESVKLGETLEDGVELTKYSEALQKIGVHILDASGEMRNLDDILDDTAEKWDILTKAQKMATAQTVAGVRQYNNFISLMDNWGDMETNLNTARNADGSLQEQADIYAESWEAARKRVKAASEELYSDLLDEQFFIKIDDALTNIIKTVDALVDSLGGVKGLLLTISSIAMKLFSEQMSQGINNMIYSIGSKKQYTDMQTDAAKNVQHMAGDSDSNASAVTATSYKQIGQLQEKLVANSKTMTDLEKSQALSAIERQKVQAGIVKSVAQELDKQQEIADSLKLQAQRQAIKANKGNNFQAEYQKLRDTSVGYKELSNAVKNYQTAVKASGSDSENAKAALENVKNAAEGLGIVYDETTMDMEQLKDQGFSQLVAAEQDFQTNTGVSVELTEELSDQQMVCTDTSNRLKEAQKGEAEAFRDANDQMSHQEKFMADYGKSITNCMMGVTSLLSALNSFSSIVDTLNDTDLSTGEKAERILMSLAMGTISLVMAMKALKDAEIKATISAGAKAVADWAMNSALIQATIAQWSFNTALNACPLVWVLELIALVVAAIGGLIALVAVLVHTWEQNDPAHQLAALNDQVETLTETYEEATKTANEFKDAVSDYNDAVKALDELDKNTQEYADALEEANNKAKALMETYGLWSQAKFENGLWTFEENALANQQAIFDKKANNAATQLYGTKIAANQKVNQVQAGRLSQDIGTVDVISGPEGTTQYISLSAKSLESAAQALNEIKEKNSDTYDQIFNDDEALKNALFGEDITEQSRQYIDSIIDSKDGLQDLADSMAEASAANEYYAREIMGIDIRENYGDKITEMSSNEDGETNAALYEQIVAAATEKAAQADAARESSLQEALESIDTSKASSNNNLNKNYGYSVENDEDLAYTYAKEVLGLDIDELDYKGGTNKGTLVDGTGNKVVDAVSDDYMREQLARKAEIDRITAEYEAENGESGGIDTYLDSLEKLMDGTDALGEKFGANFTGAILDAFANGDELDFSSLFANLSPEEIEELQTNAGLDAGAMLGLSEEDLAALGYSSAEEFTNQFNAALEEYDPQPWIDKITAACDAAKTDIESLQTGIMSGDINSSNIAESEEYQDLLNQLDSIKEKDDELTAAADMLGCTWLVGTQEYAEALEKVQDELHEIKMDTLRQNVDDAMENLTEFEDEAGNIEIGADTEKFDEAMQELLDAQYAVDVEIHAEAEQEFNSVISALDNIHEQAALIGKDFIVAADDIRELNNTFPGILEGMEYVGDGTVKLNQQIVQSAMAAAEAETKADAQSTIDKLQNQATLLRSKQQVYQNMANAALILAQSETDSDEAAAEARATISDGLAELQELNSQDAAQSSMNNAEETAESAYENGEAVAQSWGSAFSVMEESSYAAASSAIQNMNAVANGGGDLSHGKVNPQYAGGHATNSEASIIENTQRALDNASTDTQEEWAKLYEQYASLADQAGMAANDIEGMIAQIGAVSQETDKAFGGIASGKGDTTKSSESGGSKAKEKTNKDLKVLDEEIDRYHQIKELLEDLEAEVNKFSKAKDRAWGAGKIANINKEINALNKQKAALQEYQRQAKSYMSSDAAKAASYGWSIGADGNISNYDANMAAITAEYNAAVAAYNGTEAGSDAEKAAGKNVEAAQKKFDEAKKALQKYEESADLVRDLEQQIIDASYEIADLKLEAIEYTIELKLDFDERQLKLFEDIMKDFGDMADHALDKITEIEKCIGVIFDEMATNKDGISQMLGLAGVSGGTIADLINGGELSQGQVEEIAKKMQEENGDLNYDQIMSDIEGYMDKLIDLNDQLREYREQVFATLETAIDEYIDDLDRANDKIAKITKLTQGYKDLIQSIGKANVDATGELTKALNKALEEEAKSAITAAKAKEDFAKTTLDDAKALYQTAVESGDEWAINRAEEVLKKAEDEYATALEESQDATKAFVDAVATSFKDSIEQVITDLDKNLGGLKHLREQFDQSKELDAQYIEDYTKIYELSKLTRQVQSSMDETDNIRAKKELLEFQKEINAYQEQGVQMSEYELEYLQKRYELKLAEIALQEAQNAKSQVSMVQDNEGNYSYVYTADDQAVADAQQNYEDKLYALQLLNGQYINELQNNIITMQEEMSAKLQEIADDETLSQEERMERIEETREYYLERLAFYDEQLALSLENNQSLYENEWLDYHEKTGYKISANKDYVDSWEETSLAILTNVKTQGEYMNMLQEYLTQAANTARDCCQESINKLNEVGLTTNNLTIIVNGATAQLTSDAQAIAAGAQMMSAQYQSSINQIMASVQAFTAQYASMITQSIANNQRLIASMQMVIQMAAAMAAALGAHVGGSGAGPGSGSQGNNGPGNGGPGSNTPGNGQDPGSASKTADAATIAGIAASIWMDGQKSGWGNDPIRSGKVSAEYNAATATAVQQYINQHGPNGDIYSQWADNRDELKKYYASYDTGGYTGAWGTSEGKLAMLHQKELVLNATDTSNMLAIVDMVRDISSMIDLNAMSSMINTGLSAITANLNNEETLEQEVHITAEFPNATDKNEILEAFDNVINLAAQYANRK